MADFTRKALRAVWNCQIGVRELVRSSKLGDHNFEVTPSIRPLSELERNFVVTKCTTMSRGV